MENLETCACPLCGAHSNEFHRDRRRRYHRCPACRLVFVPPKFHLSHAEERRVYELHENSPDDVGYRRFLSRAADAVTARVPPGTAGLDFGSGPGPALPVMLEESGYTMTVYDPYFAPDSSVLDRAYDFVTATEVVEHLRVPGETISTMWRCVRPGGIMAIMTKMVLSRDAFARWHYKDDETHVCFYSTGTFEWLGARLRARPQFVGPDVVVFVRPAEAPTPEERSGLTAIRPGHTISPDKLRGHVSTERRPNQPVWTPEFAGPDAEQAKAFLAALADERAAAALAALGGAGAGTSRRVVVTCERVVDPALSLDPVTRARHDEGYRITTGTTDVRLEYTSARGLRNGLVSLSGMQNVSLPAAGTTQTDAPRFPLRGLIEGYYGPPWTPGERYEMLRFMAANRMNAYFYGPKDDPYHRAEWRESYPADVRDELALLVEAAASLAIDVWYTIGPGLSMRYAEDADNERLAGKLAEVAELGVTGFGLLFDDIPAELQHEGDQAAFASLARAHAAVANRLYAALRDRDAATRLVVCPTQYWGAGNEPYITELGALLDPRIDVFWTGPEICSRELTLRDAALLERTLSRPALFWDNYPVNDLEMRNELHAGPYRGRDPHLYRASAGVIANGMQYPEATKLGLFTIADYLWNPEGYDPETSRLAAIEAVVGPEDAEGFDVFSDCNRYSALYPTDAPVLARQLGRVGFLRAVGRDEDAREELGRAVERLRRGCALFDRGMRNETLECELARWIDKFRAGTALLEALYDELGREERDWSAFRGLAEAYEREPAYTFADVLSAVIEEFGRGER